MQINYKTKKLKRNLTDDRKLLKTYGQRAKKIKQRIKEIKSAENLKILGEIPQLRLHSYKGKREGEWSIDIKDNWRLIFTLEHEQTTTLKYGRLDLAKITIIKIESIEDPH